LPVSHYSWLGWRSWPAICLPAEQRRWIRWSRFGASEANDNTI
jgi:hypothetical protein